MVVLQVLRDVLVCDVDREESGMPHVPETGIVKVDRFVVCFALCLFEGSGLPSTAWTKDSERTANVNEVCMAARR